MGDPLLSVEGLRVAFGRDSDRLCAVQDLSFTLARGETLAIVGESGSGKSVTAFALLGLLPRPSARIEAGHAWFEGRDLLAMPERELRRLRGERISMIFQEPMTSLNPVLTVGRQLTEGLIEHKRVSQREARERAVEMLDLVRLSAPASRLRQYPHQLSGGMRQRAMIAMAMASNPAILIADEPTTALDVTVQAQILDLMRDLKARFGASIVLITHDMGVVAEMADRVVVMHRGRKVEEGPVAAIFKAPADDYTQRLLAAVPRLGDPSNRTPDATAGKRNPDAKPLLEAHKLDKTFTSKGSKVRALNEVSFAIKPGETLALVGESGSGKSTTGRAVLRLIEIDRGEIRLEGTDLRRLRGGALRRARRRMQMIFQDPFASLNPRMSAARLVAEPMRIHGIARGSELDDRVAELFRRVGLGTEHLHRHPHEFSGGQRQRLCIARALGVGPKLIVADEPTSALDVSIQAQVLELLLELRDSLNLAYLFISHDMAVVERMSHRVAVMHQGQIVEIGPAAEVLGAPRHPYTKALLAAVPVPDPARVRGVLPQVDPESFPRGPLRSVAADHLVAA